MIKDEAVKANDFHRSQSEKNNLESGLKSLKSPNVYIGVSQSQVQGPVTVLKNRTKWSSTYL